MEDSGKVKLEHANQNERRWYELSWINKNSLHDHERSKYRKMLVQFLESQNRVFCFADAALLGMNILASTPCLSSTQRDAGQIQHRT